MTKPTFMQSLLNKPSQSYSYPLKPNYHSIKQDMLRVANSIDRPRTLHRRGLSYEDLEPSEDSDLEDLFFTPNTSPRTSLASSIVFPTGRKPSRRSLRLSDPSDTSPRPLTPATTTITTTTRAGQAATPLTLSTVATTTAVVSTRTPSTTASTQSRNQRTAHTLSTTSSLSTTSLQPHSVISDYLAPTRQPELDDKRKTTKEGTTTKRTRHGSVTLIPSATTQSQSVKSTTTSNQKNGQQDAWDVRRPPPTLSAPSSASNGSAITATLAKVPVNTPTTTATTTTIGTPHVLASRRSSKPQTYASSVTTASSKEKPKQETEVPSTYKTKEKEKELDPSPLSRSRTKGKEKAIPVPIPKTTYSSPAPHTFSAFAPLPASSSTLSSASPTNGNTGSNNKLPPGFSFPPPPHHSPQQQQQPKNPVNGSTAAYTYAQRQKGSSSPKPGGSSGHNSIMMNMTALLEEDELNVDSTPTRRLRHMANENGGGQNKGKEKRRESYDSRSSNSSYSGLSPSRSNTTSHPASNSKSHKTSHSQSHSDASTFRSPSKTLSSEVNAMSLPTPGELPSIGTPGYTSLVLPRAPLPLGPHSTSTRSASTGSQRKWFGSVGKEGRIDLTRNGVAQTTMSSVEVVRGLGKQQGQNGLGGKLLGMFGRRRSISGGGVGPRPIEGLGRVTSDAGTIREDLPSQRKVPTTAGVEGTVLGFTSYRKPPGYLPSGSVVVQVWAVGVDGLDGRLVGVKFGDQVWNEGACEEEMGVETEWEREREARRDEEVDVTRSTPQQSSINTSLGRSFSLRKPRMGAGTNATKQQDNQPTRGRTQSGQQSPSRSFSLKRNNTVHSSQSQRPSKKTLTKSASQKQAQRQRMLQKTHRAEVGYIPGRSFVGRVLDCGWEVRDEVARKGDWVVGLLDVRRCGALAEFIVVDRHRIHRVPHPRKVPQQGNGDSAEAEAFQDNDSNTSALTLEELALLPLCGIPAYRALRTFIYTFSSLEDGSMTSPISVNDRKGIEFGSTNSSKLTEHPQDRRRRALVLRGHEGVGAMAVQMLARRGWKVSVHVPFSSSSTNEPVPPLPTTSVATTTEHDSFSKNIQDRARDWGADEIIFDEEGGEGVDDGRIAAIRVIESLREDGDVFDAILDTVGGKEVREAGERLLRSAVALPPTPGVNGGIFGNEPMSPRVANNKPKGVGQFTTLVGDVPERPIPTAGDNFRAGLRSWRFDSAGGDEGGGTAAADMMKEKRIEYAWVSVAQDVDWEGEDIADTLAAVLRSAMEDGVKPVISANHRVVPFEKAPYVFVDKGPLGHGCNVVVKIVG